MTYPYKCNCCRTRNLFKKKLEEYVRTKKCKACGHNRFYFDKERATPVKPCTCFGYHFPHRPGSPCCEKNPLCNSNRARRMGVSGEELLEMIVEDAFENPGKIWKSSKIPF